jgi:hypothetical protein
MAATGEIRWPPLGRNRWPLTNAPKTDPSVEYVVKTPEGPTGPGTTFRLRQHSLEKQRETTTRFIAIEPNRKIDFEGAIGPMRPKCSLTLEQTSKGTSVLFSGDSKPVGLLKPLSPLFNRKGQRVWTHRLDRIRCLLETPAPNGASRCRD